MQWHAGREHVRGECLNVCRPTPLMPKALAAVLIARSDFLGSTAVPLSVVKTRPVSTQVEAALSRSTAWLALTDRYSATVAGEWGTSQKPTSEPRTQPARRAGWSHNWQATGKADVCGDYGGKIGSTPPLWPDLFCSGRLGGLRWEARVHATVAAGLIRPLTCADVEGGGRQWWWTFGPLPLSSGR